MNLTSAFFWDFCHLTHHWNCLGHVQTKNPHRCRSRFYKDVFSWPRPAVMGTLCRFRAIVVQSLSHVWLSVTPWIAARQASLSFTISQSLLKLMSIELVMPSNHLILCRPLLLLPSIFPSFRVFSNELALHIRRPKYWSFSFIVSPSNEYSGLISFRIDWFDLLAVQVCLNKAP